MAEPALSIRNLKFRYPGAIPVLAASAASTARTLHTPNGASWIVDVPSLDLPRGEELLLTGGSGRGKSTLLHLIAGLMEPARGAILVAGQDMHALRGAARDLFRGRHIGMIFQTFNLLHGFSAEENVMAALMFADPKAFPRSEHRARARKLLEHLGIDRPSADPDRMSIGQQQRIAVARAVACDPALVLADEPTASLDPVNSGVAMDLIQRTCREIGAALLCVSHDPAMAERFAQRAALDDLAKEAKSQA